jgi:apocytochrome f
MKNFNFNLKFLKTISLLSLLIVSNLVTISSSEAFPIYAQNAYANPREANGRIACANCHLAQKVTEVEAPKSVLPNTVFEIEVKIPYDLNSKQVLATGKTGGLNVGAVVVLPEGFKLAPANKLSAETKAKTKGVYISPYSAKQENILVVGPIAGDKHQEITFPILSPDPATNPDVNFVKYPIYAGANRGRGQVNPNGEKSNNVLTQATASGQISSIEKTDKGGYKVSIKKADGNVVVSEILPGPNLIVKENDLVTVEQALTNDPNVGGFGQTDTEIVLQSAARIYGYIAIVLLILLCQIFLVLKKKQFEKVQAAEMNF